jgi:chitodextrinase
MEANLSWSENGRHHSRRLYVAAVVVLVVAASAVGARGAGAAAAASSDTQAPTAPPSVQANVVSGTLLGLGWAPASDDVGVAGYGIYENGVRIVSTQALSASVSGLSCGTSYTFAVDAYDDAGNRSPATAVSVSTASCAGSSDTQAPTAPPSVQANVVSGTLLGLGWAPASDDVGVAGYGVYEDGVRIVTTQALSASISGLSCGTSYTFAVDAYDAAGNRSPATTITATTAACVTPPPPAQAGSSVYWGAYVEGPQTYGYLYGGTWSTAPWCDTGTQCALDRFTQDAGKRPSIEHFGEGAPWNQSFDTGAMKLVQSRGDIPAVDIGTGDTSLAAVAAGAYDSSITSWAQAAKAWGHPFFLILDEEMNGRWYGYSPGHNGNTAADFVAAWRHMHDIFTSVGATNVTWVWCPNVNMTGDFPFDQMYPGDAYVDWTGLIGYNWGQGEWLSFSTIFGSSYADLMRLAPQKPVFVAEVATNEVGGSKSSWITDTLSFQLPRNFPQIKALTWFNWRIDEKDVYWPWEIESSDSSQQAFRDAIGSSYYAPGGSFANLPLLSKVAPLP